MLSSLLLLFRTDEYCELQVGLLLSRTDEYCELQVGLQEGGCNPGYVKNTALNLCVPASVGAQ